MRRPLARITLRNDVIPCCIPPSQARLLLDCPFQAFSVWKQVFPHDANIECCSCWVTGRELVDMLTGVTPCSSLWRAGTPGDPPQQNTGGWRALVKDSNLTG